ncbi:phage tail protein, partial [Bilophila wadsworthia]
MSQQFRTVTTNAGRNAVREALTQGKTVKLSHMSVGDGGGNPVTPLSTMTKLVNERFRAQINDIVLDPATPDLFTAELFIPQAEGGWYIREVGLWMDDGTLFAVGNTPLTEKPDISSGAATDLLVRLIIRVLDAATVSIEIDPAQVLATREYVDRKLDAHNKDGGAHETLARKSVQIKAGTGLTGGGTLEADRTLTVKYGNTAGTACQGNDVRLADARTPKPHKATHQTGGSDAITPADIGAADKTIQIKPGTGLTGGGTLEADRTLTVSYGTAAGTACQGNDARLSNARTPTAHKTTHRTGGTDALTPADIGAAPASHTSVEATDTVLGHAKASQTTPKAAGTAAVGTEKSTFARGDHMHPAQTTITGNAGTATKLSTARTIDGVSFNGSANIIHYGTCSTAAETEAKAVNCTGFVLATGARIAVRFTVTNTAANPTLNVNATGAKAIRYRNAAIAAGYLAANRTYDFIYDGTYFQLIGDIDTNTTYAVATQAKNGLLSAADKKALDYCEALRLSMIGVPRYWRSTTLPAGHVWANGDLALFADWPELKKIYDAGGFAGMLLAYNANSATIAANLGKWRPNAANPTGLYVPNLSEQFFRGWTPGAGREAGSWQQDAVETGITSIYCEPMGGYGDNYPAT